MAELESHIIDTLLLNNPQPLVVGTRTMLSPSLLFDCEPEVLADLLVPDWKRDLVRVLHEKRAELLEAETG